ncbi:MAG TPA: hypothetical protein VFK86_09660 [Bauldia sp.]|jgi:hypothetical protein|nr:hypothetical protein [Bauldia sp.]
MTYEDYLHYADDCEWLAAMAKLPANRHALLSAAEMWRKMAADIKSSNGALLPSFGLQ